MLVITARSVLEFARPVVAAYCLKNSKNAHLQQYLEKSNLKGFSIKCTSDNEVYFTNSSSIVAKLSELFSTKIIRSSEYLEWINIFENVSKKFSCLQSCRSVYGWMPFDIINSMFSNILSHSRFSNFSGFIRKFNTTIESVLEAEIKTSKNHSVMWTIIW